MYKQAKRRIVDDDDEESNTSSLRKPNPSTGGIEGDDDDQDLKDEEGGEEEGNDGEEEEGDEEEDEDEEEEEEEASGGKPRARKRRRRLNPFIEEEAAVEDDEEDDYDSDLLDEEDGFEVAEMERQVHLDERRLKAFDRQKDREEEENIEQMAERLKEKYGRGAYTAGGLYKGDAVHVPQAVLIPSVNDPKLWMVRCKPGKEKDTVLHLMRKYLELEYSVNRIRIHSAFARESLKGYLYVEADKQSDVQHAIDKINHIYASKLRLVPIKEMVDCLHIKSKPNQVQLGGWVRVKRGTYSGDIGQVIEIADNGDSVLLKLIPRLESTKDPVAKGVRRDRPLQKLFSPSDFPRREVTAIHNGYNFRGDTFDKSGFLERSVKMSALVTENVNPSLDEIAHFTSGSVDGTEEELSRLAATQVSKGSDFHVGDSVEIIAGQLIDVPGIVVSVEGDIVIIKPDATYGLADLKYPAKDLRKKFAIGAHVKVMEGVHKGQTGLVVRVNENMVTLMADSNMTPIEVFAKDLKAAIEVTTNVDSMSLFDVRDVVQISLTEVGVVVKVDKGAVSVLNQFGAVLKLSPSQIRNKRDGVHKAVTTDLSCNPISVGDSVYYLESGSDARKSATVLCIYRSFVFIYSPLLTENNGILVCQGSSLVSSKPGKSSSVGSGRAMNPFRRPMSNSSQSGSSRPLGGSSGFFLMNKTVCFKKGPYKGMMGIVKDATDSTATVEIHAKNKKITVNHDILRYQEFANGPFKDLDSSGTNTPGIFGSSSTLDNRLLAYGNSGRTPMHPGIMGGGATPGHFAAGGKTPAWDAGSRTPYLGGGGETPAWLPGSKTPHYGAGGETPAWTAGSKTPAYVGPSISTPYGSREPDPVASAKSTPAQTETIDQPPTWITVDILVQIGPSPSKKVFKDGIYNGKQGVIRSVTDGGNECQVRLVPDGESISLSGAFLALEVPKKGQTVKVLSIKDNNIGELISIDGPDGIVKLHGNSQFRIIDLPSLAVYEAP